MTPTARRNRRAGVTLLEMMVVLAIIALVVGLATPRIMGTFGRAKAQAATIQLTNISGALQLFYIDVGRYPTGAEGLGALIAAPSGLDKWRGPYLNSAEDIKDPWGRDILYQVPGQDRPFELYSLGRDGQSGGSNEDSDIRL